MNTPAPSPRQLATNATQLYALPDIDGNRARLGARDEPLGIALLGCGGRRRRQARLAVELQFTLVFINRVRPAQSDQCGSRSL